MLKLTGPSPALWDSTIKESPPVIDYDAVMASSEGVGEWTALIVRA